MIPPSEPPADPTPHEFIDAEISVDGIETPADEKKPTAAFNALTGIRNPAIARGKLSVEYDPLEITKARLGEEVTKAGYRVADVQSGPASAISDALHHG